VRKRPHSVTSIPCVIKIRTPPPPPKKLFFFESPYGVAVLQGILFYECELQCCHLIVTGMTTDKRSSQCGVGNCRCTCELLKIRISVVPNEPMVSPERSTDQNGSQRNIVHAPYTDEWHIRTEEQIYEASIPHQI